jgi:hypothetical protein
MDLYDCSPIHLPYLPLRREIKFSHPYETEGNAVVFRILIFVSDSREEEKSLK